MEEIFRISGLLLTLFITIFAFYRRQRETPALVYIALAPLAYFSYYIGFVITPAKLMGILFTLYVIFNFRVKFPFKNKFLGNFLVYYAYLVLLTLIMSMFWPAQYEGSQGIMYSVEMRGFVQIAQLTLGLFSIVVIIKSINTIESLRKVQSVFLMSMFFISIYGLYIWLAQSIGLPFNPISRLGGLENELNHLITTRVNDISVVRAYSLTGEPKGLAIDASLGIIIAYFTTAIKDGAFRNLGGILLLVPIFLLTIYLTYSTAGYIVLPIMFLIGMIIVRYVNSAPRNFPLKAIFIVFFIFLIMGDSINQVLITLSERVVDRVADNGLFTYAEAAMIQVWWDMPNLLLTGSGLGGSNFYIRLYDVDSYMGKIAAPRGVIGMIGDQGLIGLMLFIYACIKPIKTLIRACNINSPNKSIFSGILVIFVVSILLILTKSGWYLQWFVVGLVCAAAKLAEREIRIYSQNTRFFRAGHFAIEHE
jgi:hypothetical protein